MADHTCKRLFPLGQTAAGHLLQIHAMESFQAQSIPPVDRPAVATAAAMVLEKTWLFSWFWSLHWGAGFYRLIAGQGGRVPFEWLLHAGYQAFLCATHNKTRITSLQVYVCGPLLELVDSLETNLVTTRRV